MGQLVLDVDRMGRGSVVVDGKELQDVVRGVRLDCHAGEPTHAVLELMLPVRSVVTDGKLTFLVGLGNRGGAGDTLVEALERLLDAVRDEEGVIMSTAPATPLARD